MNKTSTLTKVLALNRELHKTAAASAQTAPLKKNPEIRDLGHVYNLTDQDMEVNKKLIDMIKSQNVELNTFQGGHHPSPYFDPYDTSINLPSNTPYTPETLAHEMGHHEQSKLLNFLATPARSNFYSDIAYTGGIGLPAALAVLGKNPNRAAKAALAGLGAFSAPLLASEYDASRRAVNTLHGVTGDDSYGWKRDLWPALWTYVKEPLIGAGLIAPLAVNWKNFGTNAAGLANKLKGLIKR